MPYKPKHVTPDTYQEIVFRSINGNYPRKYCRINGAICDVFGRKVTEPGYSDASLAYYQYKPRDYPKHTGPALKKRNRKNKCEFSYMNIHRNLHFLIYKTTFECLHKLSAYGLIEIKKR